MTFRYPPTWRVIADGQSLATTTSGGVGGRWIDHLMEERPERAISIAVDGNSWTNLAATQSARVRPYLLGSTLTKLIFILCGGQGDLIEGDSAATLYSDMSTYAESARTIGAAPGRTVYVIAQTIPRNGLSNPGIIRPAANELIKADAGNHFDAVVDVDVPPLDDPFDPVYYNDFDTLHWTSAGCQVVAGLCAPALDAILEAS